MKNVFDIDIEQPPRIKIPQYSSLPVGQIQQGYLSQLVPGGTWQYWPRIDDNGNIIAFNFSHNVEFVVTQRLSSMKTGSEIQILRYGVGNVRVKRQAQDNTIINPINLFDLGGAYINQQVLAKLIKIGDGVGSGEWVLTSLHDNPLNSIPT